MEVGVFVREALVQCTAMSKKEEVQTGVDYE